MKIETTRFGSQEVEQDTILHFPKGLLNNTQLNNYKLFHKEDSDCSARGKAEPVVFWLQSVDDPNIAYTIFDPSLANFYYEVSLPDEDYDLLSSQDSDDIAMMVIVTTTEEDEGKVKKEGLTLVHANITEPLFINLQSLKGIQRSIKDLDYDIFMNVPIVERL